MARRSSRCGWSSPARHTTAVPSLDALLASSHSVEAVLTRPDAPAGRGRQMAASAVAERARHAGIEVLQPRRLSDPAFLARLREIAPDCCPVVAYGKLDPRRRSDRAAPRLGQPALLGAASLARRCTCPACDPARRRDHRSDHVPARGRARRWTGLRRRHRAYRARRYGRGPARQARPIRALSCW